MRNWKYWLNRVLGRELYEHLCFFYMHNQWPNFKNPRSFSEHIIARKLTRVPENATIIADKYAARDYVSQKVGKNYLSQIYWVGDAIDNINWDALPNSFVIKGTHGCGAKYMEIVEDKAKLDIPAVMKKMRWMLANLYGASTNENFYEKIKPQILIEERLRDKKTNIPQDFKCFVFHGKFFCVQVDVDRFGNHQRIFYDANWQALPFRIFYPFAPPQLRPKKLDEMIKVAEKLGEGFEFLRVDLYCVDDEQIVFGELTMTPSAGRDLFLPDTTYSYIMGSLWSGKQA